MTRQRLFSAFRSYRSAQQQTECQHVERANRKLDRGDRHAVAHEPAEAHALALTRTDAHAHRQVQGSAPNTKNLSG